MNPLQMSAQFAAYMWFMRQESNAGKTREEAHRFARTHWERFLPSAQEGFGRLLIRLARRSERRRQKLRRHECLLSQSA
jgi:hypothetical protein